MHYWGSSDVDWKALEEAAEWIHKWLERGGISVAQSKEKYGRVFVYLWRYPSWHRRVWYYLVYKMALKKWPQIHDEIINGADYPEILPGLKEPWYDW